MKKVYYSLLFVIVIVLTVSCEKRELGVTFYQGKSTMTFINTSAIYKERLGNSFYLYIEQEKIRDWVSEKKTDSMSVSFNGRAYSLKGCQEGSSPKGTGADFGYAIDNSTGKMIFTDVAGKGMIVLKSGRTRLDSIPEGFVERL